MWGVCSHIEGRWESCGKLDQEKKKDDDEEMPPAKRPLSVIHEEEAKGEVDESPQVAKGAAKAKSKAKKDNINPCAVCGMRFSFMPKGSIYCEDHYNDRTSQRYQCEFPLEYN